jgi:dTMP kinase
VVVCDRYVDSSFAYQAYARGLGMEFVSKINAFALESYQPDLTFFIDLSPEEAFQRKHGADENDRMEKAGLAFHKKVYEGYLAVAKAYPERVVVLDGRQSIEEIAACVRETLESRGIVCKHQ